MVYECYMCQASVPHLIERLYLVRDQLVRFDRASNYLQVALLS